MRPLSPPALSNTRVVARAASVALRAFAGTTKGTSGDDKGFYYEKVAPLLLIGVASLICI